MMSYEIFGGPWCSQCKTFMKRLESAGVAHLVEYRDVEYPHNEQALRDRGGKSLPAFYINGQEVDAEEMYKELTK